MHVVVLLSANYYRIQILECMCSACIQHMLERFYARLDCQNFHLHCKDYTCVLTRHIIKTRTSGIHEIYSLSMDGILTTGGKVLRRNRLNY